MPSTAVEGTQLPRRTHRAAAPQSPSCFQCSVCHMTCVWLQAAKCAVTVWRQQQASVPCGGKNAKTWGRGARRSAPERTWHSRGARRGGGRTAVLKARVGNAQGSAKRAGRGKNIAAKGRAGSNTHAHNGTTEVKQWLAKRWKSGATVGEAAARLGFARLGGQRWGEPGTAEWGRLPQLD